MGALAAERLRVARGATHRLPEVAARAWASLAVSVRARPAEGQQVHVAGATP